MGIRKFLALTALALVVTLSGIVFFRERLEKQQWLAFAGVIAALILLNI